MLLLPPELVRTSGGGGGGGGGGVIGVVVAGPLLDDLGEDGLPVGFFLKQSVPRQFPRRASQLVVDDNNRSRLPNSHFDDDAGEGGRCWDSDDGLLGKKEEDGPASSSCCWWREEEEE